MGVRDLLEEAAQAAIEVVRENTAIASELTGTRNPFGDKTLVLDRRAEEAIIEVIRSWSVPTAILSEEAGIILSEEEPEYLAVIDPIDGSANLERRIPLCSVGIALVPYSDRMSMHDVEASLVRSYFTDEVYVAIRGEGAFRNGERVRVREEVPIEEAIISYDTKKRWDREFTDSSIRVLSSVRDMRRSASNLLDLCWVAGGSLDAMVDLRNILPIVHIMGTHIVLEAGGTVVGVDGKTLDLEISMTNRMSFVAASGPRLAEDIRQRFVGVA